jgi:hypothetical protein
VGSEPGELVSAAASKSGCPLVRGARSLLLLAAAVFAGAYVVGARVVPAVMRLVADRSRIAAAPVTAAPLREQRLRDPLSPVSSLWFRALPAGARRWAGQACQ